MAVATLEDRGGSMEAVVFPETYAKYRSVLDLDRIVIVTGKLEKDDETARLIAVQIQPIEAMAKVNQRTMVIKLTIPPHTQETVESLAKLFDRYQGTGQVTLEIDLLKGDAPVRLRADLSETRIRPSEALVEEVERLCGKETVTWS